MVEYLFQEESMKASFTAVAFAFVFAMFGLTAQAADKEVTLKGEMTCGKCSLKETEKCQNVLKVTEGGKETKYYVVHDKVAKDAHGKVCSGSAKATVKGTVKEDGGKKTVTAASIAYE
jgi:hypothetical protein